MILKSLKLLFFSFISSPVKVKEDDEVDKLDIKFNKTRKSKRTYQSPSPEVGLKISRSLKVSCLLMCQLLPIKNMSSVDLWYVSY